MLFKIKKDGKGIPQLIETSSLTEQGWKEKHLENYCSWNCDTGETQYPMG